MIARLALAAVMFASVPLMAATHADAAPREGKRFERSDHDRKGRHGKSHKSTKHDKKTTYRKYSRYEEKSHRRGYDKHHRHGKRHGWKSYKYGYWGKGKRRWGRRSCYAAAKRRGGYGKRLWGIGGKAYGRHACDRAMYKCRRELRHRKSTGRNPFARCVIVSRS